MRKRTPSDLLAQTVAKDTGCWEWQGSVGPNGYGRFGRRSSAHRFAYETFVGPIPDGMCVCHTCDNRICVNPAHLWIGTIGQNNRDRKLKGRNGKTWRDRGVAPRKTHCLRGHEFTPENTMWLGGRRQCRACDRARPARKRVAR